MLGTGLCLLPGSRAPSVKERMSESAGRDSSGSDLSEVKSWKFSFLKPQEISEIQLLQKV